MKFINPKYQMISKGYNDLLTYIEHIYELEMEYDPNTIEGKGSFIAKLLSDYLQIEECLNYSLLI